ncbi:MAG: UDP-N-acetylmuramoyl-L-alanine--D-glutamate ligase [Buchnera aphidicola (Chaetogeoica yunlongensis)]
MICNYSNKKILIFGMGITGISCINFFLSKGIFPKVMDTCKNPKYIKKILKFKNISYHIGSINYSWILESTLIIVSPGINSTHPAITFALKNNIEIIGDIELFLRETNTPIISITGSNGKSSVTMMVNKIIQKSRFRAYIGGNIGIPALSILNKPADYFILELSSFQLEYIFNLKSYISTILNITPDHMDRHHLGMEQYIKIKQKIYKYSKICIINIDDPLSCNKKIKNKKYISFGLKKGDYHLDYQKNNTWICYKQQKLLNTKELKIFGQHNYINVLSALSIVHELKINLDDSLSVLKNFLGLPHRFQIVNKSNNILWINDSKSTNVASTVSAINSIQKTTQSKIRLILGGDSKSANFTPLKNILTNKSIVIYCYGKCKKKIFNLHPHKSICSDTLSEIIYLIFKQVKPTDIVLLSPACSSLDQFSGFRERGNTFTRLIKHLIKTQK